MRNKGNSLIETRRKNRVLIKNMIFDREYVTRTELAESSGLTLPTITTSVNEMIAEGMLEDVPIPEHLLPASVGRRPQALTFRAEAACAIGIEPGPYATYAMLMDIKGNVIDACKEDPVEEAYEKALPQLAGLVKRLQTQVGERRLLGVGIAFPGYVDPGRGVIRTSFREDWEGRSLVEDMERLTGLTCLLENNVRLRAVEYAMMGDPEMVDSFAYLYVSRGIACPVMIRDRLFYGYQAGAGEAGHMIVTVPGENGPKEKEVNMLASEHALRRICRERMRAGGLSALRQVVGQIEELTMEQILEVQRSGDEELAAIIRDVMRVLGIALANIVNLLSPPVIVVNGILLTEQQNQEWLVEEARSRFFGLNEQEVRIVFREYDEYSGAKGGACMVIKTLLLDV